MRQIQTTPQSAGLIIILAALVAFGPLSIDMYLPSLTMITDDLGADIREIKQTITFFLVGFSVGMFFYGPLSDRFGRRKLLFTGMIVYIIATIGCIFAANGTELFIARLAQALGGASASVLARAIVRDLYSVQDSARILSWMHTITMIATLIAPILGSYLADFFGWRSIFVFLLLFAGLTALVSFINIKETLPEEARIESLPQALTSYFEILKNRRAIGYIGCMGMAFAGMFVYITASPFVYIEHFGVTSQHYALLFGLNIFSIMAMTIFNARQVRTLDPQKMIAFGATTVLGSSLFMLVVHLMIDIPLSLVVLGLFFFVGMTGLLSANCIAKLMGLFPKKQAGAAAGLAVSVQFGLGGLLSFIVSQSKSASPAAMIYLIACAGLLSFLAMMMTKEPATSN